MALYGEHKSFFCLGNLSGCKETVQFKMKLTFADNTVEEYTGIEAEKCGNAKYYSDKYKLYIAMKELEDKKRAVDKIEIIVRNPAGPVERLNISYGIAAFSEDRKLKENWESQALRCENLIMTPTESGFKVELFSGNSDTVGTLKTCETALEKNAEDITLNIETDLKILSHYGGDDCEKAKELLNNAVGKDVSEALNLIAEAEALMAKCIGDSVRVLRTYRNHKE